MTASLTRRRMLTIVAAAGFGGWPPRVGAATDSAQRWRWRGVALGADATILLDHPHRSHVSRVIERCLAEVARLERIFSLFIGDSDVARLNRDGSLARPSHDLIKVLSEARRVAAISDGAFDVTVQPLWRLYAEHFAQADADPEGPPRRALAQARRLVDWRDVDVSASLVRLPRPSMAITLNGIAQGYIADRVAEVLADAGFTSLFIDLGEKRVLGPQAGGEPWRIAIADPIRPDIAIEEVPLASGALATSGGYGTVFDALGRHHHLFDPKTGRSAHRCRSVSVTADTAVTADALSTALAVAPTDKAVGILRAGGGRAARLIDSAGELTVVDLQGPPRR